MELVNVQTVYDRDKDGWLVQFTLKLANDPEEKVLTATFREGMSALMVQRVLQATARAVPIYLERAERK